MLPCRGSSFDLASRLYYFYHPSLALQSNERTIINFTSSTSPSLNNVIVTDTPVIRANFINTQTGFVATTTAVPICTTSSSSRLHLNRRGRKRSVAVNSTVSGSSSNTVSSCAIASQVLPSDVNSGIPSTSGDDIRNVLHS